MAQAKCVITISSGSDGDAEISVSFDPPMVNDDHEPTTVETLALVALKAMADVARDVSAV
jgi:hypothetical protein